MTQKHIFVFFISLLFLQQGYAQSKATEGIVSSVTVKDSTKTAPKYYGLRIGVDLSKPLRTFLDDNYEGLEIAGDFRITDNYYLAAEIGNETRTSILTNINNTARGSYIKAGFNYNVYENWFGMNNLIYVGLRGAFSTFSQELNSYTIYTINPLFGDDTRIDSREFTGLNSTWLEFQMGLQTELYKNIYLGIHVQLKRSITRAEPDGFENVYIPGFGKTTDGSKFGVGYGYTLSYLIPIFKK